MFIICELNNFSFPRFMFSGFAKHEPTNLCGYSRTYYWLVMPEKELKMILSHDLMQQPCRTWTNQPRVIQVQHPWIRITCIPGMTF